MLTEDALPIEGVGPRFRVRWTTHGSYWSEFKAYEVAAWCDNGHVSFLKDGWMSSHEQVDDVDEAEIYASGSIKWDGCSDIDLGDHHWCGENDLESHFGLLRYVFRRAFELMGRSREDWVVAS